MVETGSRWGNRVWRKLVNVVAVSTLRKHNGVTVWLRFPDEADGAFLSRTQADKKSGRNGRGRRRGGAYQLFSDSAWRRNSRDAHESFQNRELSDSDAGQSGPQQQDAAASGGWPA
jgi:hypothetical protein